MTMPRRVILDFLAGAEGHLSVKEIQTALLPVHPELGLTTVYRTMELLNGLGMVHRTAAADGQARYALKREGPQGHHHHLICTGCGRIIDYRDFAAEELALVRKTEEALARKHDFLILDHNIEFLGLCGECRRKAPDTDKRRS